ncbi:MAG TPA: PAS domain S-box protein [Actinomycetota bacterium]|nr:PAS domain S-box protein [Actinomycetota bacterium]
MRHRRSGNPDKSASAVEQAGRFHALVRRAFDESPVGMLVADLDGRFLHVNDGLCEMFGLPRPAILGSEWTDLVHPDEITYGEGLARRLKNGEVSFASAEARMVRADGTNFWSNLIISLILGSDGTPACFFAQVFDITAQKQGQESRAQYASTVELVKQIATRANETDSVEEALRTAVTEVCNYLGWAAGHVLLAGVGPPGYLNSTGIWHLRDPERFSEFVETTKGIRFTPGKGLPGETFVARTPLWIPDPFAASGRLREPAGKRAGIRAAFAFPVFVQGEVAAVLEFFDYQVHPRDELLIETVTQIGTQLGHVMERFQAAEALRESEHRNRLILDTASDAFIEMDESGRVITWNRQAELSFGWAAEEVIGRVLSETIVPPEHRRAHDEGLKRFLTTGRGPILNQRIEISALRKDGQQVPVELTIWAVLMPSGWTFSAFVRDIAERVRMQEELVRLSTIDELTRLKNRRAFLETAVPQLKVARRLGHRLTLLFIDLDRMKEINDKLGHLQGDRALIDAAEVLRGTFREADLIGRVGGDEFCVLLVGTSEDAGVSAARLQEAVEKHNKEAERPFRLSLSIGSTTFDPENPLSIEQLMDRADRSMYRDKARLGGSALGI